jgi:hydrogenase maturation protein HypF
MPPLLATGAELKNTFCITRDRYAFLSHHIGDMENYETYRSFEDGITHFQRLFRIQPQVIAYDLHPNYLASRYAIERSLRDGLPSIGIQHHHAHIISCLADNGISGDDPVIGVAFDGTGYGLDGHIWGGEFLVTDNGGPLSHNQETPGFLRPYHLGYYPLPGGDASTHKPARIALAYLYHAGIGWETGLPPVDVFCAEERSVLRAQLEKQINTPLTSSMGRLFDAVAALAGIRQKINYEAQAAIELEATVDPEETGSYSFSLSTNPEGGVIDPSPLISEIVTDVLAATPRSTIAARFHNTVASMVLTVCLEIRKQSSINTVALSGGVWQNMILLSKTVGLLNRASFQVRIHRLVPANDGGLALGQAVSAYHRYLS